MSTRRINPAIVIGVSVIVLLVSLALNSCGGVLKVSR